MFFEDFESLAFGIDRATGNDVAVDETGRRYGFVVLFGKADREKAVHWGLKSYNDEQDICDHCPANRTTMPFTDLRSCAASVLNCKARLYI